MSHERLLNETVQKLANRALSVIAPCLREEEQKDAFLEFAREFRSVLLWYEFQRDRMRRWGVAETKSEGETT